MSNDKKKSEIPPYSGWRPASMRWKAGSSDANRGSKRDNLGSASDRFIYKSAHGYRHPEYGRLCRRADTLNNRK